MNARLLLLALGTFAASTEAFMIAGILQPIARDLHISIFSAGQFVTVFSLAYAIGSPVLATLTGKWERRSLLTLAMLIFAAGNLLCGLSHSYTAFMIGRIIASVGAAMFVPAASTTASALVSPEKRGRALAIVIGGQTIALATGVPLGSWIAHSFNWQASFWLVSGIALVASLLIRLLFPAVAPQFVPSLKQRLSVAVQPVVGLGLLVTLLWSAGAFTFYTYVSDVFLHLGATEFMLTFVLLVWGIASFFGSSMGGYITDRLSPDRTINIVISGSMLMLTGIAILSNVPHFTGIVVLAAAFMALYGMFTWAFMPAQQSRLVRLGGSSAGIVISLNASAIYLGSASGAFLGGLLVGHSFVSILCFAGVAGFALALLTHFKGRAKEAAVPAPQA